MDQTIFLIGQDKVGKTRFSTLFSFFELAEYECIHFNSFDKIKNALTEDATCLILIHSENIQKITNFLDYLQENYSEVPVLLVMPADRTLYQTLIAKGAFNVIPPDHVDQISLMQSIFSAISRKRIENELNRRDGIQKAVNYAAEVFLSQLDWGSRIKEVLGHFGKSTQSDRVYIYKNEIREEQGLFAVQQAGWTKTGVQPLKEYFNVSESEYQSSLFSRGMNKLRSGEVFFGNTFDLPSEEQSYLMKMGIQTIAIAPIFTDQILWGFIGFDHCEIKKNWSLSEIETLKTATKIIGAAVARQGAEIRLTIWQPMIT